MNKTVHPLKAAVLDHCRTDTDRRIAHLTDALAKVEAARDGETKSSAGDKFETGRAMMQLEAAKLRGQLAEAATVRDQLAALSAAERPGPAAAGSLVATNRGNYYLAAGLGRVRLDGRVVYCTSLSSPVGRHLLGARTGDSFTFNELTFEVLGVV